MKTTLFCICLIFLASCRISRTGNVSSSGHYPSGSPKVLLGTAYGTAKNNTFLNFSKPLNNSLVATAKNNLYQHHALDTGMYFVNFTTDIVQKNFLGLVNRTIVVVSAEVIGHPGQKLIAITDSTEIEYQPMKVKTPIAFYFLKGKVAIPGDSLVEKNEMYLVYHHNRKGLVKSTLVEKDEVVFRQCETDNTLKRCGMKVVFNFGDQLREGKYAGENDKYFLIKTNDRNPKMVMRPKSLVK